MVLDTDSGIGPNARVAGVAIGQTGDWGIAVLIAEASGTGTYLLSVEAP